MRLRVANRARDPLLPDLVLCCREPFLRQYFDEPGMQVENKKRIRRIVLAHGFEAGWRDQFFHGSQFRWNFYFVGAGSERQGYLEISEWLCHGKNPLIRLFEPAGNRCKFEALELVGIEAGEPQIAALRTPHAQMFGGNKKWTTISIQCQTRPVRLQL